MVLTFVLPVSTYHEAIVERAVASVQAQTLRCEYIVIHDRERRGAGWARNTGLAQVTTPFVSFLDADDWLEPTFAEACLRAYDGTRYVFTSWWGWSEDLTQEVVKAAPTQPWTRDYWHIITTLLPTEWVRRIGGFDETVQAEDSDFYYKLTRSGCCGLRLNEPLFHYGKEGRRARALKDDPQRDTIMRSIMKRYEGVAMPCGDCGDPVPMNEQPPIGAQLPGDVLAQTLWKGNRPERGRRTGRIYRGGWGARTWVAPEDVDAAPQLFARVVQMPPKPALKSLEALRSFQQSIMGAIDRQSAMPFVPETVGDVPEVKPDAAKVMRLYGGAVENEWSDGIPR
jgi:Glycosyl transferase family 2